jgi:hypothetical protein
LKTTIKYLILFTYTVLFLYYYDMIMPKNIWYLLIGIPILLFTAIFIMNISDKLLKTKKN